MYGIDSLFTYRYAGSRNFRYGKNNLKNITGSRKMFVAGNIQNSRLITTRIESITEFPLSETLLFSYDSGMLHVTPYANFWTPDGWAEARKIQKQGLPVLVKKLIESGLKHGRHERVGLDFISPNITDNFRQKVFDIKTTTGNIILGGFVVNADGLQ